MKRMYEKLMAYEEAFVANEYVAACYGLACSVGSGNSGDKGNMTKKVLFFMNMISYLELVLTQVLTVLSLMMVLLLKALVNIIKIKAGLMVDLIIGMIEIIMALLILKTEFIGIQKVKKNNYWGQSFVDRRWNHYGILAPLDSSCPSHS